MHSATLHGVGVITKLYFVIFAAFKESMTLNLAQRSFKVIDFGTNRKRVYIFLLVVNSNFYRQRYRGLNVENRQFPYHIGPTPIPAKIWVIPCSRSVMLGCAERGMVRLIAMKLFYLNVTDRLTDRRTDRQLVMAIPRSASYRAVIHVFVLAKLLLFMKVWLRFM